MVSPSGGLCLCSRFPETCSSQRCQKLSLIKCEVNYKVCQISGRGKSNFSSNADSCTIHPDHQTFLRRQTTRIHAEHIPWDSLTFPRPVKCTRRPLNDTVRPSEKQKRSNYNQPTLVLKVKLFQQ